MYVRLAVSKRIDDSHLGLGLFHAAEILRAEGLLADHERALVEEAFRWFNRRLPVPGRFARSSKPHARARAISWFKDSAGEFLSRMEDLAAVLEEHGYAVSRRTTDRPGYIVYEDAYQVLAEPFRGER